MLSNCKDLSGRAEVSACVANANAAPSVGDAVGNLPSTDREGAQLTRTSNAKAEIQRVFMAGPPYENQMLPGKRDSLILDAKYIQEVPGNHEGVGGVSSSLGKSHFHHTNPRAGVTAANSPGSRGRRQVARALGHADRVHDFRIEAESDSS